MYGYEISIMFQIDKLRCDGFKEKKKQQVFPIQ